METWLLFAIGAALFAALTTVLAKVGVRNVDSHLATAIRTVVVLLFAWVMVFVVGSAGGIHEISPRTWVFLVLSGLATGGSWLCYFRALQLGNVNKVVPIDKSSTILTMVLAFIILSEPVGVVTAVGMVLMAIGTWLMIELKQDAADKSGQSWLIYAVLAAVFASLVAIFGRIGVQDMDASLWTAIRTVVVVPLSWGMVFMTGGQKKIKSVDAKSWTFLTLSGVATGVSWLFFYHALQNGNASHVVPIDKLSILLVMLFARIFLAEKFSRRSLVGLVFLTVGTLLPVVV
ncbi:MAG: EamA family transporter [Defluviitaleaceae bacterium]|nr:EamA family transporter [Defluviitaleaceae bacterium]